MKMDFLKIGKIVGTHGVRGMVRIEPWADSAAFLKKFNIYYLEDGSTLELSKVTPHKNIVLAAIKGIDSIDTAETLRGKTLFIKRDDVKLPKGRYFIEELLSSKVYNSESGELLGVLTDVLKTGANDVWQITNDGKDYLVPVIDDLKINVDIENEEISLIPLKGIFDDES